MVNHTSAREREETPHAINSAKKKTLNLNLANSKQRSANSEQLAADTATGAKNKTGNLNGTGKRTISDALRQRAQAVIKDKFIDAQSRALIRYALETNDPWLPELVRRANAGERIIDRRGLLANARDLRRRFKRRKD